jgi:hypothetical protein
MNRFLYGSLIAVAGLLLISACGPQPAPENSLSHTATPVRATELPASPAATATNLPPTEPPAAPTTAPTPAATATTLAVPEPSATSTMVPVPTPTVESRANADVLHVRAVQASDGSWTFHVTVEHPDTGWEDYADGWDVVTPDGMVLKPDLDSPFTRLLLHPHESEQPFTRSQSGIVVPSGVTQVRVRAHDLVDGFGGREVVVDLTVASGQDFEVELSP